MNNWQINKNPKTGKKYKSKEEALATCVGLICEAGGTVLVGGQLYKGK